MPVVTRSPHNLRCRVPALVGSLVALLGTATLLSAHDFWLVPDAFQVTPGGMLQVRGQTSSSFPTSESAVTVDRVTDARLIGADGETRLTGLSTAGASLLIRHAPTGTGQHVVAVRLAPRTVREAASGFKRYMELEGAPELAARYEREGRLPKTDSITRRYAKYAKTMVEVGHGGARTFSRVAGHPVELVPLTDPAALRAGDTLAVRLLYAGRPLPAGHLRAGAAPDSVGATASARSGDETAAARNAHAEDPAFATDAEGVARIPVMKPGLWNVRTIHIVPADMGPGADWDVHWATLVFGVAPADTPANSRR